MLLGPSIVVARLGILIFTLTGGYFWFRLVDECSNKWTATVFTILLFSLPGLLRFEKSVMLEIPSLASCIAASYFWIRYLRESPTGLLYVFAVAASLALLTKQNAIYLPTFCLLSVLAEKK
jgi:4-amino-4-deoxy-L-arabinose transferase-like glycosyltransferase